MVILSCLSTKCCGCFLSGVLGVITVEKSTINRLWPVEFRWTQHGDIIYLTLAIYTNFIMCNKNYYLRTMLSYFANVVSFEVVVID